jgi:hypothetical protein
MRFIITGLLLLCSCAYGSAEPPQKVYGHHYAEDGAAPMPPDDPNGNPANDMYQTGCFTEVIQNAGAPPSTFLICNGIPFNIKDIVDPGPEK